MTVWAIIPVKPLARAKSRLSPALSVDERKALAERMLRHVLSTVRSAAAVSGTLVISRDSLALALARDLGAHTVQESGTPELNRALMRATQVVTAYHGSAVLVLPADLPLLTAHDVNAIVGMGEEQGTVVVASDRASDGTNALFIRPPGLIEYAFGPGSRARHLAAAADAGARGLEYQSDTIALDIDVPADLDRYRALNPHAGNLSHPADA